MQLAKGITSLCLVLAMSVAVHSPAMARSVDHALPPSNTAIIIPINEAASAGAALAVQGALGWLFSMIERIDVPPDVADSMVSLLGQVQNADDAQALLDDVKDMMTPQQRRGIADARRGIEDALDRIPRAQRKAIYQGIAQALPDVVAQNPELKHFIPGVLEEFGIKWRDVDDFLSRQDRRDINGTR